MSDTYVLVMDAATRNHRILKPGDVLRDAAGNPAIALQHVLTTGDDAVGQDVRNVGQLTFDAGDNVYLSEDTGKLKVTSTSGLDAPVLNVTTTCALQVGGAAKLTVSNTGLTATVPHLAAAGSAAAPAYSFSGDPDTGMYSAGANTLGFACNGAQKGYFDINGLTLASGIQLTLDTQINFTGFGTIGGGGAGELYLGGSSFTTLTTPTRLADGAAAVPSIAFTNSTTTGIYRVLADQLGISAAGTLRLTVSSTGLTATVPFLAAAGAVGTPSYSFSGDPNTGLYSVGADQLGVATNGVLRLSVSTSAIDVTVPIKSTNYVEIDGVAGSQMKANGTIVILADTTKAALNKVLSLQPGLVGAPSLYLSTDTTTGLYRPAANEIGVTVSGAAKARLFSGGFSVLNGGYFGEVDVVSSTPHNAATDESTLLVNAGTGNITVNLPAASGLTGRIYFIKKTDASANTVTIDASGGELIDGVTTKVLTGQYDAVMIQCDGTGWHILAFNT